MRYKIAIFASGTGSNTANIINRLKGTNITVGLVVTNNPKAGVIDIAIQNKIPYRIINREDLLADSDFTIFLKEENFDLIVLAGFLWLIPANMVKDYYKKIVNIHPALLPKYGGKGMYGMRVHKAVKADGESKTGITIHFVNERYDEGDIIFQKKIDIKENDSPEVIAQKVHHLEYDYFPKVIKKLLIK